LASITFEGSQTGSQCTAMCLAGDFSDERTQSSNHQYRPIPTAECLGESSV
jgi:hypothetical protein